MAKMPLGLTPLDGENVNGQCDQCTAAGAGGHSQRSKLGRVDPVAAAHQHHNHPRRTSHPLPPPRNTSLTYNVSQGRSSFFSGLVKHSSINQNRTILGYQCICFLSLSLPIHNCSLAIVVVVVVSPLKIHSWHARKRTGESGKIILAPCFSLTAEEEQVCDFTRQSKPEW